MFNKMLASEMHKDITAGFVNDFFKVQITQDQIEIGTKYDISAIRKELEEKNVLISRVVDLARRTGNDTAFIAEMQVQRRKYFGRRSLLNVMDAYSKNYGNPGESEETRFGKLIPVRSMNLLGYIKFAKDSDDLLRPLRTVSLYDDLTKDPLDLTREIQIGYFEYVKEMPVDIPENIRHWREFLLNGKAPSGAPEYIKKAERLLAYENLSKEEHYVLTQYRTIDALLNDAREEEREALLDKLLRLGKITDAEYVELMSDIG
jgi:hypothetical protein